MDKDNIIWWTAVCNNRTIRDAFWSYSFSINTSSPDFTDCMQDTVLSWGPSAIFIFSAIFHISYLSFQGSVYGLTQASHLNIVKMMVSILLAALAILEFAYCCVHYWENSSSPSATTLAQVISPAVFFFTQILVLFVIRYEFMKGVGSSGVLFGYWLLVLVCDIVPFRSMIMKEKLEGQIVHLPIFVIFYINFGLVVIQFTLHLWSDQKACDAFIERECRKVKFEEDSPQNENPILRSSFLNRVTWFWASSLLKTGYKKPLNEETVWDLIPWEKVKPLITTFYQSWLSSSKRTNKKETFHYGQVPVKISANKNEKSEAPDNSSPSEKSPLLSTDYLLKNLESTSQKNESETWQTQSGVIKSLFKSFGLYFCLIGLFEAAGIVLTFLRPVILDELITYVETDDQPEWQGWVLAFGMVATSFIKAVVGQQAFYGKQITGLRVRSSLMAGAYRKALILSNSVRKDYSVGEIVNFMSVDSNRIAMLTHFLHSLWTAPLNIIVAMFMLWSYLGVASLAGLLALVLLMGLNGFLASRVKKYQVQNMTLKDKRTRLINEILNGMKVLKLNAWEEAFQKNVGEIRAEEVDNIKKSAFLFGGSAISFTAAPIIFSVVSFAVFILGTGDKAFSAQIAFVSLTLVNNLTGPLTMLPNLIANFVQAVVSVERLNKYFNAEELDPGSISKKVTNVNNVVEITDATFSWDEGGKNILDDITFSVKKGDFVAIVGQVGSGKSSLISAILGEMQKEKGLVSVQGSVAYVPQEAWIRNETLEKNVKLGSHRNEKFYNKVIQACALKPDLEQLPSGDQTEIGEKGINLSGGQKQRVSLARAVYQDRDIYLLDDPLSAVDVHVGKHLFDYVLGSNGMLKDKTRILVTHSLTFLPKCDYVICLEDGRISEMGAYSDLLSHNGEFADLIRTYLVDQSEGSEDDPEMKQLKAEMKEKIVNLPEVQSDHGSIKSSKSGSRRRKVLRRSPSKQDSKSQMDEVGTEQGRGSTYGRGGTGARGRAGRGRGAGRGGRNLIEKESSEAGGVNMKVVGYYLKSLSLPALIWVVIGYLLQMGTDLGSNIWLSEWSEDSSDPANAPDPNLRLGVYGGIGGGQTLAILIQVFSLAIASAAASNMLHDDLLHSVIRCPMSFFDTTPMGRILNRFSNDMSIVDQNLRGNLMAVMRGTGMILTTIIAISYTTPIFLAVMAVLSVAYYWVRKFYVTSSNQLRRVASVKTSPIYSHFGESLMGASSIRAYQMQTSFTHISDDLIDKMQKQRYAEIAINRWLSMALEVLGGLVVLFSALYAVIGRGSITGGLVGLSISYSLKVTDRLAMFVRNTSDFESNIVSVERIREYTKLTPEAPWYIDEAKPNASWPLDPQIQLENYGTRYRPGLDLVLKDVSATIAPSEKFGIVGRTGAGKSSMMLALFRLIEPANGKIIIDGVDVANIGLHDLRSKLTIIPQDPVLFSGTLRMNLDPFNSRSDEEIWQALQHAHLKKFISGLPEQLEYICTEGGSNLSVGQKQLMCLARALLRKTKILVLDEATAAVDLETDDLIQATIRSEFKECTVLTIAHRISTVLDYDRIMVLDNGEVQELDSPTCLLANKDSTLYSMAKEANLVT